MKANSRYLKIISKEGFMQQHKKDGLYRHVITKINGIKPNSKHWEWKRLSMLKLAKQAYRNPLHKFEESEEYLNSHNSIGHGRLY